MDLGVYETMWKDMVESSRPQITIWHITIASWITKATNKHSDCIILITFPLETMVARTRLVIALHRGADKSLSRPGRKQATATEHFDVHTYYL